MARQAAVAHTATPSMRDIAIAQNDDANVRFQVAARRFYRNARLLQFLSSSINVFLALISPFVLLLQPEWGAVLGAIAGGWLFVSRQVLASFRRTFQRDGAKAQEAFDCAVFGLPWNHALARPLSHEEIGGASRKMTKLDKLRDWYPTSIDRAWPSSVIVCQRSSIVWARRQHHAYAYVLRTVAALWGVVGVVVALAHGATLTDYLVTIALPSLPALLDASELADRHLASATDREALEQQVDAFLGGDLATQQTVREIQDQLFSLRSESPIVATWFYRLVRSRYEQDMQYAAAQSESATPGEGRHGS
jgi:SMODS-associating 4TM effector domain